MLLERNTAVGMETSSRNSEVIHAGLYYGADSLKTRLCIKGKNMLYDLCKKHDIPHKNCGKWIVAQNEKQFEELNKVHELSKKLRVPTSFISLEKAREMEPDVKAKAGVLASPSTGILDSHAYMQYLLGAFEETEGDTALNTTVTSITPLPSTGKPGSAGWKVTTKDGETGEKSSITCENLINSAGLGAVHVNNMLMYGSGMGKERSLKAYYAKGNYFSYAASSPRTKHLIYPAPEPGLGGLGTHLTFDMAGQLRFGPDVEWVDSPKDLSVSAKRLPQAIQAIKQYLPSIDASHLQPDYAGIRPKLARGGAVASTGEAKAAGKKGAFVDFIIRKEEGIDGFVNLLGIESPGLTSSLAIGDMVEELVYGDVKEGEN